ncbi:MAG: hypothetical protein RBS07_15075 [Lentimicrobium sp.]|jgi:hypothetical protein|nr:hypothetical protein [Lentimicrobium sp.]
MAIKLYYNKTTYQLIGIDDNSESLVVGDDGGKELQFYFGTGASVGAFVNDATIPLNYLGRAVFKRADDESSNEIYLTPVLGTGGGYFKLILTGWFTDVEGNLEITTRLKVSDGAGGYVVDAFSVATLPIEPGFAPTDDTITDAQYEALQDAVDSIIDGTTDIAYDNATSGLTAETIKDAIDELDGIKDDILDGTQEFTKVTLSDGLGNTEDITYASKVALDVEVARLETANMVKSIVRTGTHLFTLTFYDGTTSNILTLEELKAFIGEATQSLAGLMSATDKTELDTLVALFDSDADDVVNTIAEILAIFEDYPEGVDLVTALAGKVDKTTTIAGVDLQNNITKEELKIALDIDDAETNITNLQNKDIEHEKDLIDHEQRIDSIEAITRKQDSDVATVDDDGLGIVHLGKDVAETAVTVKVDGLLLDSANRFNLVTGTVNGITYTVSGNQITLSGTASAETTLTLVTGLTATNKVYVNQDFISGTSTGVITLKNGATSLNAVYGTDYSGVVTLEGTTITLVIANGAVLTSLIYKFNINRVTVLISNKQYSPIYNTTFDLMTDEQIKAQMDLWVQDGTLPNDIMSVDMDKKITGVGKNLFDLYDRDVLINRFIASNGAIGESATNNVTGFIKVKPLTAYVKNDLNTAYWLFYDINKTLISVSSSATLTVTTPSNCYYLRTAIRNNTNYQLEAGSTATAYEPYRSTSMYLDTGGEVGYSFEGTRDSIEFRNGKAYFINRINDTQTGLRTTPIETPISVIGNVFSYPRGTFYIEDMVRRHGVYNAGITVDKPIKTLNEIYRLNDDGSSTKLAVSGATVAGNGLSFTHSSLSNGDFIWFDYYYRGTNIKGLTTVRYYGDKMIVADSVTGTVYKIIFTIASGVITVDKVAV